MYKKLLISSCVLAAMQVSAEPIKGEAELGLVMTTGNSATENLNTKLKLTKTSGEWLHEANVGALSSSNEDQTTGEDETTAEKYFINYKADRTLDEHSYLYGITTYEDDRFSGFEYQATAGVGYGYKVIAEEDKTLSVEVGPGYRINSIEGASNENEVTLRVGEKFSWKFSENAELNQYLTVEGGEDNTISNLGVGIKSMLNGTLSLRVGIDVKHTENPVGDKDDIDTETYATIGYNF